jgi:hypothetical protein
MQKYLFRNKIGCVVLLLSLLTCCKAKKTAQTTTSTAIPEDTTTAVTLPPKGNFPMRSGNMAALAPAIIYKTQKDYSHYVPVQLSEDKKSIVSYPAPSDLMIDGKIKYPVQLQDGYWLDERGITPATAYLSITCEEYSQRGTMPPSETEMMKKILDTNPIVEMYNAGPRSKYKDLVNDLNRAIADKKLGSFEKIK